ncbi:MAG: DUF805 domain-containing protein [Candidatus Avelusimicrobium sp.]|uniref:DUF805 domain-containing protein n=1 Tax=Candidatus Avelusimicrobium sp. TaxID=3048833 RepID=UPI003F014539
MNFFTKQLKRAFDFEGRASRQEFWLYFLCLIAAFTAAVFAVMALTVTSCAFFVDEAGAQQGCGWIGVFIALPLVWLGFPILLMGTGARRLHDSDKSGWWQLLCLIPSIGLLIMIILMTLPGIKGENRFGLPPNA